MDQAEQLRNIVRMNNQTQSSKKVARVITVTSGKGRSWKVKYVS